MRVILETIGFCVKYDTDMENLIKEHLLQIHYKERQHDRSVPQDEEG